MFKNSTLHLYPFTHETRSGEPVMVSLFLSGCSACQSVSLDHDSLSRNDQSKGSGLLEPGSVGLIGPAYRSDKCRRFRDCRWRCLMIFVDM